MDGNAPRPEHLALGDPDTEGLLVQRFGLISPGAVVFHHTTVKVVAPRRSTETKNQGCQSDTGSTDASVNTSEPFHHGCSKKTECFTREISRDESIRTQLEQHLIYISHCVKPNDITLNLHCFTEEQKSEIQSETNLIKASRRAIEILLNEANDPGRFAAFRDSLHKDESYPKIVRILDGDYDPEDQNYVKIVELFTPEIIVRIEPSELLPRLLSKGVFKQTDLEEIWAEERNHGKMRASCVLLMFLPRRTVDWFPCFLEALIECELDDIAEMLDPDHFKDIKLARKTPQGFYLKNAEQQPTKKEKPRIPPKPKQLNKIKHIGIAKENLNIETRTNEQNSYSSESCTANAKEGETHKTTEETNKLETSEHVDEVIEVADVSEIKIEHLTVNDCEREKFEKFMANRDAKVIWPNKRRGKSKILLRSISKENSDQRMWNICKRNCWRHKVKEGIKHYFEQTSECNEQSNVSKILSRKSTPCKQKINQRFCSNFQNLKIQTKEELVTNNYEECVKKIAECRLSCGRIIYIVKGSLVDIEVDVMVSTTGKHLTLTTGLAETISDRGGETIKLACARHIKSQRSIDEGEIFVTDAGNLPAKYVIHVNSPVWKGGGEEEDKVLREAVMKSMMQASKKNAETISLPAISCGISGFSNKIATGIIIRAVRNFFREEQESSLKEVYLVDIKTDVVKRFREALAVVFKDDANCKIRDLP